MYNKLFRTALFIIAFCVIVPDAAAGSVCLLQSGQLTTISGSQTTPYDKRNSFASNVIINAETASWKNVGPYAVQIGNGSSICFYGGRIEGTYPPSTSWDVTHGTAALYLQGHQFRTEGLRVHNYGDGIRVRPDSDGFYIDHVHFTQIKDDCIENDFMSGGTVHNSLFDGCYNAFSARPGSGSTVSDGSSKIWRIQNSLIRLEAIENAYGGTKWAHAGFFKWDKSTPSKAPKIALVNNIFRADQNADTVGLAIPAGKLIECSNNTMVWLGQGNYPEPLPSDFNGQSCFTVTKDKSVWDAAAAAWLNQTGTVTPSPKITSTPTQTPTPAPAQCALKSKGDANCDASINLVDFEVFRQEYMAAGSGQKADFDANGKVNLVDFEMWRRGYTQQ